MITALVLACLMASRTAHAGYYEVSYTGGQWVTASPSLGGPYTSNNGGYDAYAAKGSIISTTPASASFSGQITATFQWMATAAYDPPPASAIITEQCSASAGGYGYSIQPTVAAADGFGDPATNSGGAGPNALTATSSGSRYSVKMNPGDSFTVQCSPSGSVSILAGYVVVNLTYSAVATPVTVNVTGVISVDLDYPFNVLIGQKLTVSLNAGNYTPSLSNWSWQISGDKFAGFNVGANSGGAVELQPAALTVASVNYYYRSYGGGPSSDPVSMPSIITCNATFTDPKNVAHAVTGTTVVNVYQPKHQIVPSTGNVNVFQGPSLTAFGDPVHGQGIAWSGSVTQPAGFTANGVWAFAQIITPSGTYMGTDGKLHLDPNNARGAGLDGFFPYAAKNPGVGDIFPGDGTLQWDGDSPTYTLLQALMTSLTMMHTCNTFMIYEPPNTGNGVTWVPLHEIDWTATGTAQFFAATQTWVAQGGPTPVQVTKNISVQTLPAWNNVHIGIDPPWPVAP